MEEKEQKILDSLKGVFDEKIKTLTDQIEKNKPTDIQPIKDEIKALKETHEIEIKSLKDKQDEQIVKLKQFEIWKPTPGIHDEISEAVKKLSENIQKGRFDERLKIKTVGDMLTSSNVTGTGAQPQRLTPISEVRLPEAIFQRICNVFRSTEGIVTDVSQDGEEGGADRITEGLPKSQYDFNIYGTQYSMLPVNAYTTISRNMLLNFPYLENFIRTRVLRKVLDKATSQILEGGGSPPEMKGVSEFATAWDAGIWAAAISSPNLYHVLIIGIAQCRSLNYNPTYILLNPKDAAGLRLAVMEGKLDMPELVVGNGGLMVAGVPVIETTHITADSFQLGEYNLSNVAIQSDFELFVDPYSGLKTNKITLLGEMFMTHFVAKADAGAFIKGDITDDIAALTLS